MLAKSGFHCSGPHERGQFGHKRGTGLVLDNLQERVVGHIQSGRSLEKQGNK